MIAFGSMRRPKAMPDATPNAAVARSSDMAASAMVPEAVVDDRGERNESDRRGAFCSSAPCRSPFVRSATPANLECQRHDCHGGDDGERDKHRIRAWDEQPHRPDRNDRQRAGAETLERLRSDVL